jgi:hypothetical protein
MPLLQRFCSSLPADLQSVLPSLLGIETHGKPLVLGKSQPAKPEAEGLALSEEPGLRRV